MKLQYERCKGSRFKRRPMIGIFGVESLDGFWWHPRLRRWVPAEAACGGCTTHYAGPGAGSVRAFRRLLRSWRGRVPPGAKFVLVSVYPGCNIIGRVGAYTAKRRRA